MKNKILKKSHKCTVQFVCGALMALWTLLCLSFCGCEQMSGYSSRSLFPEGIGSVFVEMFDNRSFRRGVEYELTVALAKRIEAQTPYKIVSS